MATCENTSGKEDLLLDNYFKGATTPTQFPLNLPITQNVPKLTPK